MTNTIRILIVDDHKIVRKGFAALLATETDLEVVAEASNGFEVLSAAAELRLASFSWI